MIRSTILCLLAAGAVLAEPAAPAASPARTNTVITSDRMEFEYQRQIAVFEGHVVVVDPEVRMQSDRMTVIFSDDRDVKQATASVNVTIETPDIRATCERAVYSKVRGEIILTGNAVLTRERDTVSGDKITYWVETERMEVLPGTLIIVPSSGDRGKGLDAFKPGAGKKK
jgi:lipopolysaccharide export system protein LptA